MRPLRSLLSKGRSRSALQGVEDTTPAAVTPSVDSSVPVHYFGLTRFSVFSPTSSSWRLTRREKWDHKRYADYLYSDERMEPRCDIFGKLAAPLYQQMAHDRSYKHFVLYSPQMPKRWLNQLHEIAHRNRVLELVETSTDRVDGRRLMRDRLVQSAAEDAMVFAFRIDDDDLLAVDYLDQVAPYVVPAHQGWAVSFASGFAGLYEDGDYTDIREHTQPLPSMGQGAIGRWTQGDARLELEEIKNHGKTHYRRPVILDARRPTWLQTRHVFQDTAVTEAQDLKDAELARGSVMAKLERLAPVDDADVVGERFPTLRGHLPGENDSA